MNIGVQDFFLWIDKINTEKSIWHLILNLLSIVNIVFLLIVVYRVITHIKKISQKNNTIVRAIIAIITLIPMINGTSIFVMSLFYIFFLANQLFYSSISHLAL